jgi:hypothetical protein
MLQHQSSPRQGGGVQSCGTCGNTGAILSREGRSGAAGHVAARGSTPCSLSCLEACMLGYPVYRVPIVAVDDDLNIGVVLQSCG